MRILMLNSEFPPYGGGVATDTLNLLMRLASDETVDIDLITSGKNSETQQFSRGIRIYSVAAKADESPSFKKRELLRYAWLATSLALKLHAENPYDLCFAWNTVPAGWVAMKLRQAGLPYAVRISGSEIPGHMRRFSHLFVVLRPVIKRVWRNASAVVVKCAYEQRKILELEPRATVLLIHNGVDVDAFRPREERRAEEALRVLCVGRLIEHKGQHDLLEAIASVARTGRNIRLTLVGEGKEKVKLQTLARTLGIEHLVDFRGQRGRTDMPGLYADADVFALPSYQEAMNLSIMEAMAAGLPILTTKTGGTEELIVEGRNGHTFEWGDVPRLSELLTRMADDPTVITAMGEESHRHIASFTLEKAVESYLKTFADVATPESRP